VGERQNGKSFILDKILNLSGVKGNHVFCYLCSSQLTKKEVFGCGHNLLEKEI
jgi:hypothetical protein